MCEAGNEEVGYEIWSNTPIDGFDTDRESFIGLYNGLESPRAVVEGKAYNSVASGWQPIDSHFFNIVLKPDEEKEIIFVLGFAENNYSEKWEVPDFN